MEKLRQTFRALNGFGVEDPPPHKKEAFEEGLRSMEIRHITAHIRGDLLRLTHEEFAGQIGMNVHDVFCMEKVNFESGRLQRGFVHRYTRFLDFLDDCIRSPDHSAVQNGHIQSGSKVLARALIEQERYHPDHAQWTRRLSREELLEIYPEAIVNKILAGRRNKGKKYNVKRKRTVQKTDPVSLVPIPDLPSDEYIARLLYDYAHSGECPTSGRMYTLYPDRLTQRVRVDVHANMRRILCGELKVSSPDEINMDDVIKLAYKMCVQPEASGPSKRYGKTGTAYHTDGLKKDYD